MKRGTTKGEKSGTATGKRRGTTRGKKRRRNVPMEGFIEVTRSELPLFSCAEPFGKAQNN